MMNRTIPLRHWAKHFRIFCVVFSAGLSNFHSANRGNFFRENFNLINWFNTFVRFFGGKTLAGSWTLHFLVSNGQIRAEIIFWETCFPETFVRLEPIVIGRLAGNLGAGLLKLHSTGPVKIFLVKFFRKTFIFAIFPGREENYMRSFCWNFFRSVQSCILVVEKNSSRKNIHFGENTCTNVSGR